ncbi:MAG: hypothetical protein K8S54_02420 [Spirochaetia bacterium]|nr:hypothetical protein [Spirochaetia bacterium]
MSSNFVPILGREDLNPYRLPVRLFNQRFIDPSGNIFKIHFDFRTREARVVQVVKTRLEAMRIRAKLGTPAPVENRTPERLESPIVQPVLNPTLAADLMADVVKISPRIAGIIAVLKECSQHGGEQGKTLLQVMREADLNCIARAQVAIRLVRSSDSKPGDLVTRFDDRWLQNSEICFELCEAYQTICEALVKLKTFHGELINARDRIWTRTQKRSLEDAEHTLQTMMTGATKIAKDLSNWTAKLTAQGSFALSAAGFDEKN